MKLTKYEHACFTVEKDGQLLVVDPGNFTTDFIAPENVVGVIITHEHPDHFDKELLASIVDKNPEVIIVAHESITAQLETPRTHAVEAGDTCDVGPFHLEFSGGKHAEIHSSFPALVNLGVMINDLLYYPGDSFTLPGKPVDTLALPVSAPWLKVSEARAYLDVIKPRLAFPTHDAILSDIGKSLVDKLVPITAQKSGIEYKRIEEPIEI